MTTSPAFRVYGVPALLGVLSIAGLVLALMGDGVVDALAVALVTSPLAAIVRSFLRGRAPSAPVPSEPESQDRT
jgi:hypothetical protein